MCSSAEVCTCPLLCATVQCLSQAARQAVADNSRTVEMTGRYSRLATAYSKKRVKYTKENKHKHNIPDAKAFL
jgi:hypothetical protein